MEIEQLSKTQYCWAISIQSRDDGFVHYHSYFSTWEKANERNKSIGGKLVQITLWKGNDGDYYAVDLRRVPVDLPLKTEVLKKLSKAEQEALGL